MNYFQGKNGPYLIAEIGGNHECNEEDLISLRPKVDDSVEKLSFYIGKKAPYDIPTLSPLGKHFS